MAEKTLISWTDATWNPITGCKVSSPGCTNCYAMRLAGTRLRNHASREGLTQESAGGPVWNGEVRFNAEWLEQPMKWRRPRKIFVVAHGDLFRDAVPETWIDRIFDVMARTPHHTYQLLTKHPDRAFAYLQNRRQNDHNPLPHAWIGCSVENQHYANKRRESMQAIHALGWATWVSYEPALGPVSWDGWQFIQWLVSGGESGPGARPAQPDWFRNSRDWCLSSLIPFNHKQNGAFMRRHDTQATDRLLDGVLHNAFPLNKK
jgi:protein gp37